MSDTQLDPSQMTEDDVLVYTRGKRMALATELTKNGIPTERDTASLLLNTLDGLDRSSLNRLKIKAEEKANKNNENAAAIIAQMLGKIDSRTLYQMPGVERKDIPSLPSHIPTPEIVEGELDTNPQQIDFETFSRQFEDPANLP